MKKLDTKDTNPMNVSNRLIEIVKSNQYKCGNSCIVRITDTGFV